MFIFFLFKRCQLTSIFIVVLMTFFKNIFKIFHLKMERGEDTTVWVKPLLGRRTNLGFYETLVQELRFEGELEYKNV